jgi:hypothetical protein
LHHVAQPREGSDAKDGSNRGSHASAYRALNSAQARPGGCLKYGLGGAVTGHIAGGHRWKGAAISCLLGISQRRRHEALMRNQGRSRSVDQRRYDDRGPAYRGERPRTCDRDVTGSTGGFNRGGYFNRSQASF